MGDLEARRSARRAIVVFLGADGSAEGRTLIWRRVWSAWRAEMRVMDGENMSVLAMSRAMTLRAIRRGGPAISGIGSVAES